MAENPPKLNIENVVATATLDHRLDLLGITKAFRNVDYRPKRFPGLVFRLKRPKTSTLIFRSGKMVCTGANSERQARSAIKKVLRLLKKGGFIILSKPKVEIVNVVASGDVGERIDLEMAADIMRNVIYEPEQFPGLIHRMEKPKVVILLYASGKLVCTGAKLEKQVYSALKKISMLLEEKNLLYKTS